MIVTKVTYRAVHTYSVGIEVADGPLLDAHLYYDPDMMYRPERFELQWNEDGEPESIWLVGATTEHMGIKRSFGLKQAPGWLRELVQENIAEAEDWKW
jgi:hypothetical protein